LHASGAASASRGSVGAGGDIAGEEQLRSGPARRCRLLRADGAERFEPCLRRTLLHGTTLCAALAEASP
jgi:hypothetical protein